MILDTVGCSFTYAQQRGWPNMLANKITQASGTETKLRNHGHPGAGNTYIADRIILNSHEWPKPDLAVIMWSGLTRKDLAIDHTDKILMSSLDGYHDFVRWSGVDTSYILSGGIKGSWEWHPMTKQIFDPLYKISSERSMAQDTLLNILSLQNYFKERRIPYIMSSYVNYWGTDDIVAQLDYGIGKFPDLTYLVKQIDFTNWVFANNNKDGIYELAKQHNGLEEDNFHPDFPIHEKWSELLLDKVKAMNLWH